MDALLHRIQGRSAGLLAVILLIIVVVIVIIIIILLLRSLAQSSRLKIVNRKIVCLKLFREGTMECDGVASLTSYGYLLEQIACLI